MKSIECAVVILLSFSISVGVFLPSHAGANEASTLLAITRARDISSLEKVIEHAGAIKSLRLECDAVLRTKLLPTICFKALVVESQDGTLDEASKVERLEVLIRTCVARTKVSVSLDDLKKAISDPLLPKACRDSAAERRSDLIYLGTTEDEF